LQIAVFSLLLLAGSCVILFFVGAFGAASEPASAALAFGVWAIAESVAAYTLVTLGVEKREPPESSASL
jgi:hypothetical protein